MPGRIKNRYVRPSPDIRTARAASPYNASGSSAARTIKLAKVSSMPWAASPFKMKLFSELNVRPF
jgi:hypothetical protein